MRSKLDEMTYYKLDVILFNYQSVYLADRRHIAATCVCQDIPDRCLLTETWQTKEMMDGDFELPQYSLIRAERESKPNTTAHGGVLRAFHKALTLSRYPLNYKLQVRLQR